MVTPLLLPLLLVGTPPFDLAMTAAALPTLLKLAESALCTVEVLAPLGVLLLDIDAPPPSARALPNASEGAAASALLKASKT